MIIVGFILLGLAVAAAIVLIAQNPHGMMTVHALGNTYTMHAYWVFVAGMIVLAVAAIGLTMMRSGVAYTARVRRERRDLAAENARLNSRVGTPVGETRVVDDAAPVNNEAMTSRRHAWGRRTHRTV
jgi:hypothetical protein